MKECQSPQAKLAAEAIEEFILNGNHLTKTTDELTQELQEKAGTFVSLKNFGALRGCIGTFEPRCSSIAEEIIQNAISSSTKDPRFSPLSAKELDDIDISVDVLSSPESVESEKDLDPVRYGIIVQAGWKKGLLLPDLEGVDTVAHQIEICRMKAGIQEDEEVKLSRFTVQRYK